MKRAILTLSVLALAAGVALAGVSKDDLKKLISAGVSDEVISAFIKANGPVDNLSADDIIELKKCGASDKLLQSVLGKSERAQPGETPAPAAQPQPQAPAPVEPLRTVEREYVDRPVYVERPSTTYYSLDYYSAPTTATAVWCHRHRSYDHCTATTYTYYPSSTYYYTYPSYSYYSGCSPTYSYYYHRHHHHRSRSVGIGW